MNAKAQSSDRSGIGDRCRIAARYCVLAVLQASSPLLTASVQAQTNACEQLKGVLAKRLPSDVRGYSLEAEPASAPVPPGARVIGTCEAGAYKILYRRSVGGAQASPGHAGAAGPASGPPAAAVAPVATRRPLPSATAATSATSAPRQEPVRSSGAGASGVGLASAVQIAVADPVAQRDATPALQARPAQPTLGLMAEYWRWGLALVLLLVVGWAWSAYRRAYDAAGLPRGPRL